jgi:hypothetical protein
MCELGLIFGLFSGLVWCLENRERIDQADSDDEDGDRTMEGAEERDQLRSLEGLEPTTSMRTVTLELLGQLNRNERCVEKFFKIKILIHFSLTEKNAPILSFTNKQSSTDTQSAYRSSF